MSNAREHRWIRVVGWRSLVPCASHTAALANVFASRETMTADADGAIDLEAVLLELSPTLASGQLIADEGFALFDAMSALEVGDVKMDAGARTTADALTLDVLIARGRAPIDAPCDDALVRVFDALLACEGTFRAGSASATTTLSNAYVAARERFDVDGDVGVNVVLRAYVKALVGSVWTVKHVVRVGDVYEEEDFVMHDFGEPSAPHAGERESEDDEVLIGLSRALDVVNDDATSMSDDVRRALKARLEFRRAHHELMKVATRAVGSGSSGVLNDLAEHVTRVKACLATMRDYYDAISDEDALDWDPNAGSFSQEISLHRLGGVPPRDVTFLSVRAAFNFFEKEVDDVIVAAQVFQFRSQKTPPTIDEVIRIMEALHARRAGTVALSLAAAELLYEKQLCGWSFGDVVLHSVWNFVGKKIPSLDANALESFMAECEQPVSILIRSFCVNRTRLRRVLRRILGEMSHLQLACDTLDVAHDFSAFENEQGFQGLSSPHIAWAENLAAYLQRRHLELGFSLDLYLPHEFPMLYYYMGHLQQISMIMIKRQAMLAPPQHRIDAQYNLAAAQIKMSMFHGLRFMFAALAECGKIRRCETAFSGEDLRFWQRFGTFQSVELPPVLLYGDYMASIDANMEHFAAEGPKDESKVDTLARVAQMFLTEVRTISTLLTKPAASTINETVRLKLAPEAAVAQKIAAKNSIALKLLLTTDMTCDVDYTAHDIYVVASAQKSST